METKYIGRLICDSTDANLFRVGAVYDLMEVDGEYFVFNDRYEHSEVFKSAYRDSVWLYANGSSVFQEVAV
ncbi:hypothetical protein YJ25_004453 [Salmonella enterica subsp. enterica]|nr:hypothetical protein [Salmonella enterica subsp. enterica]